MRLYGRRFTTEETFRDAKDAPFGLGLSKCSIGQTHRRDRVLLVLAIAIFITSVVGRIALRLKLVRANKAKKQSARAHSILSLGRHVLHALATREVSLYLQVLVCMAQVL